MELRGSCLCGTVQWAVTRKVSLEHYCHCGQCQKTHGTAFGAYGGVREADFRWLSGKDARQGYASSPTNRRWHCGTCGSPTPGEPSDGRLGVTLGPLEGEGIAIEPGAHIFVESKAPWHEITDALPRFDTWPPGFDFTVYPSAQRETSAPGVVTGSCLCGGVGYEVEGGFYTMRHCHCARCRRARGAPHATNAICKRGHFRWTQGEALVREWKLPEAQYFSNAFCTRCGAQVPRVDPTRDLAVVPAGSLDSDPGLRPTEHIWVGSGAPWFAITDALPQHVERT